MFRFLFPRLEKNKTVPTVPVSGSGSVPGPSCRGLWKERERLEGTSPKGSCGRKDCSLPRKFVFHGFSKEETGILPACSRPLGKKSGKGRHISVISINTFGGLSQDWVGAKNLFVCVCFSGHFLWGRKHTNKIPPPKAPHNLVKCLLMWFCLCVFFAPRNHVALYYIMSYILCCLFLLCCFVSLRILLDA